VTAIYVYGRRQTGIEQLNNSTGTVWYLHHDQAGSTRLITGSTGTVTGKCTYSAYGTPTCEGTTTTPLGYDAQYTSSDTGLIYMRARVYDPATAQFLSIDPAVSITKGPYTYAGNNPLNLADPTGLSSEGLEIPGLSKFGEALEAPAKAVGEAVIHGVEWVGEHPTQAVEYGLAGACIVVTEGTCTIAAVGVFGGVTAYNGVTACSLSEFARKELLSTIETTIGGGAALGDWKVCVSEVLAEDEK
jgi:RHS repeat-associated protein